MIELKVMVLASLVDLVGKSEFSLKVEKGASVSDVIQLVAEECDIESGLLASEIQLVAFNHHRVDFDTPIVIGGELALMPPITGG